MVTDSNDATSGKEAHDSVNSIMYFGKSAPNTKVGREEFENEGNEGRMIESTPVPATNRH